MTAPKPSPAQRDTIYEARRQAGLSFYRQFKAPRRRTLPVAANRRRARAMAVLQALRNAEPETQEKADG